MAKLLHCVALVSVCSLLAAAGSAQDAVRSFGTRAFATDAFDAPAARLHLKGSLLTMLRSDGRAYCLGDGGGLSVPLAPAGTSYVDLQAVSAQHGIALLANGQLLAIGAPGAFGTPPAPAPGTTFVALSVASSHALALRSDGVAVSWGIGLPSLPTVPAGVTAVQANATYYASLLRLSNGQIVAGVVAGTHAIGVVPALPTGLIYTSLWSSDAFAVAVRSDGVVVAWGDNAYGQLNVPVLPPGTTWVTMGLGWQSGLALRSDGALVGWGSNTYGQVTPPAIPAGLQVTEIVVGNLYSALRLSNGSVLPFGELSALLPPVANAGERWQQLACNNLGVLLRSSLGRIGSWPAGAVPPAPTLPAGMTYTAVSAAEAHAVALRSDGRAIAWGNNANGQLAIPALPVGMTYVDARAGGGRTVLRRSDGVLVECGNNGVPTIPPPPPGVTYVAFDLHAITNPTINSTILLQSDGAVTIATTSTSSLPSTAPALPPGVEYVDVTMGQSCAAALRSDGEVVVVGYPLTVPLPSPPSGVAYVQIDAYGNLLLARRSDGLVTVAYGPGGNAAPVPTPWPGESIVEVRASLYDSAVRIGPTSTYVTYAAGCAGTLPPSRLVPRDTPAIGLLHRVTVFDLPENLAVMVFGWGRTAPTPLAALGMPGCFAHVTIDASVALVGAAGVARVDVPIPNVSALIGVAFTNQAIVFDAAANAAGLVVSDAAEGVIGRH